MIAALLLASQTTTQHARAELVCAVRSAAPREPFLAAVAIRTDPGWHVYWKNPGDTGIPTSITWAAPKGWKVEPLEWPTPSIVRSQETISFAYEGQTSFLARITPGTAKGDLRATVSWLVCQEACVPGSASLRRQIPVGVRKADTAWSRKLATLEKALPKPDPRIVFSARRIGTTVRLSAKGPANQAAFFPLDANAFASEPANGSFAGGTVQFDLKRSEFANSDPTHLRGLLVSGRNAVVVDVPIRNSSEPLADR